jgi:hypothetical protein
MTCMELNWMDRKGMETNFRSVPRQLAEQVRPSGNACDSYEKCSVRLSIVYSDRKSVIFLSLSTQVARYYLEIGHDSFLLNTFNLTDRDFHFISFNAK